MKHKHCEVIKAWAEGSEIEVMCKGEWMDAGIPTWSESNAYRIKPPAPKWPETTLEYAKLYDAYNSSSVNGLMFVANAALAHALEIGQVVLPDVERDRKIARAARDAVVESAIVDNGIVLYCWFDADKIINGVKP